MVESEVIAYTTEEGGYWIVCCVDVADALPVLNSWGKFMESGNVVGGLRRDKVAEECTKSYGFHALKFANGREWDFYNGWRPERRW